MAMHIEKGDAIKFIAVIFRVKGRTYKRLSFIGVGYALENEYNNLVHVDNGIMIVLVKTEDIVENYGKNILLTRKNETFTNE